MIESLARIDVHAGQPSTAAAEVSFRLAEADQAKRVRAALRRRLAPNTGLHGKQLGHAIGISDRAVRMIMAGEINPSSETLGDMIRFFWSGGDRGFLAEVLGLPDVMPVSEAVAVLEHARRAIGDAMEKVA